jgi:hypothetical protein
MIFSFDIVISFFKQLKYLILLLMPYHFNPTLTLATESFSVLIQREEFLHQLDSDPLNDVP